MSKEELDQLYMTTREVAQTFRVDQNTVVNWIKKGLFGEGNVIKTPGLNGHYRVSRERVMELMEPETPTSVD